MNEIREKICKECRMLPSIHHLEYPDCRQPRWPLDGDEWQRLGCKPTDPITVESVKRMMEISIRPYCLAKMLTAHPVEWWARMSGAKI